MKTKTKRIGLALLVLTVFIALVSVIANERNFDAKMHSSSEQSSFYLAAGNKLTIMDNGESSFKTIVVGEAKHANVNQEGISLESFFYPYSNNISFVKESATTPTTNVITYGRVSRVPLSVRLADDVDSRPATSYVWGLAYENGVLSLYANSKTAINAPVSRTLSGHDLFRDMYAAIEELITDGKLTVSEGQYEIFEITKEKLESLIAADDKQYEDELVLRRELYLEFMKEENGKFVTEDFGTPETGNTLTTDFGVASSGTPDYYPTYGEHPRILFTSADIPAIRAKLEASEGSFDYRRFMEYINTDTPVTGILPAPKLNSRGFHNWDGEVLNAIQANALYYALYGDEYHGYVAIYAIKNYLLTLNVDYIVNDQCREFGNVMYIAACVYDWCYDLLSDTDKLQIALGVEHKLCRGNMPDTLGGSTSVTGRSKMEIGFPPSSQFALVGHGSEFQLLRDYLAMSIAIYDEVPGWYKYVAGRYYNEYVPAREKYYEAGLYPQGTAMYGPWRFIADCFSAALITTATGNNPFSDDMANVVLSFAAHETTDGLLFKTGDGSNVTFPYPKVAYAAVILSHVFADNGKASLLRRMSSEMISSYAETNVCNVRCPEYFIFASREVGASDEGDSWRDHMPLIVYNGAYMGQYIVRNEWTDNAAIVLMKVGEKTTANHDHEDAGTFQIHYKGLTSGPSGVYDSYNSVHWSRYYQETVSKNGLLIFDPSEKNSQGGWYSGGQRTNGAEPANLESWYSGSYDRAEVTGFASGYSPDSSTAKFAYLAGDITKAYSESQASYVGRSMLTVYTGDEKYPMIFFVFDRIDAAKEDIVKKFLLQVNGSTAPEISEAEKRVVIEDADGQLVLQNVFGADKIEGIGGEGANFLINGQQCTADAAATPNLNSWGRVELSSTGSLSDMMLNVIYVSDKGNEEFFKATGIKGFDNTDRSRVVLEGAQMGRAVALFATDVNRIKDETVFTASGEGLVTYYVGGLLSGTWRVSIDGKYTGSVYATEKSGLITFTAPAGKEITLTPGKDVGMTSHVWGKEATVDRLPTCTEDGLKSIKCIKCGIENCTAVKPGSEQIIPALHKTLDYTYTIVPTLFTPGEKVAYCETCGQNVVVQLDSVELDVDMFDATSQTSDYALTYNIKNDILNGKHFYPTLDDPNGNDLYLEFSILWNESLANISKGYVLFGSLNKNANRPWWFALTNNCSGVWCQTAGGFEYYQAEVVGGNYSMTEGDDSTFPNIGKYGWHRIGIKYHLDVTWNGNNPVYTTIVSLYIDGVEVSAIELYTADACLLYTAEKDSAGNIVYSDIDPASTIDVFRFYGVNTNGKPAYFVITDISATAGDSFVINAKPVADPEAKEFTAAPGVSFDASLFYEPEEFVCENHRDANDDGVCDIDRCAEIFFDGCDLTACFDEDGDDHCDAVGCDKLVGCEHDKLPYETVVAATMFSKGEKTAHCDNCGEDIVVIVDETLPNVTKFDDSSRDVSYKANVFNDVLDGKHFYPTEENPDGLDLFVEFSLLWNDTLANSEKGWAEFARFHAKGKLTSYDSAFWYALKDDCTTVWCQEAGGFEYGTGDKVTFGPAIADGGEFPFIGEYGWHRIGIQIHQEVASVSGSTVTYKFISTLYVDGVKTSVIEYADMAHEANRLFTAEVVNGELVYSDIDSATTILAYRVPEQTVSGGDVYFVTADTFITAGEGFVVDVTPVKNPANNTFKVGTGVVLDAKFFYDQTDKDSSVCRNHTDANDDGICDSDGCEEIFFDGCDTRECLDSDRDGLCDNEGCDKETDNRPTVDGCDHEFLPYETLIIPTMFSKGKKIAHCDNCGEDIIVYVDESKPNDNRFNGSTASVEYRVNVVRDVLDGKHFYPTEENPDGLDLFVEFSLLWNETLKNSAKGWAEFARFHAKGKLTSYDSAFWYALKDDCTTVWCQEAGGFEYGTGDKVTFGPAIADGGEFPFIGEYGWHRIGIQIHQEVASVSGSTVTYKFISTLYVDGVKISVIEYADMVHEANRLFTAEVVDGELVYSDIDSATTILAYRVPEQTVSGGDAYFVTADTFITAGNSFLFEANKLEDPWANVYTTADGTVLDAKFFFELDGYNMPDGGDTPGGNTPDDGDDDTDEGENGAAPSDPTVIEAAPNDSRSNIAHQVSFDSFMGNNHFYPTEDDPDGKALFVEYSMLWNPTLANLSCGYMLIPRISEYKSTSYDAPYWVSLKDNCSKSWCQYAGGFEAIEIIDLLYGPPMDAEGLPKDQYPNIGEYGWHRIGVMMYQTAEIVDGSVEYTVTVKLYIDGVLVSAYDMGIRDKDNYLFTAEIVNGELVYSDIESSKVVYAYYIPENEVSGNKSAYFIVGDLSVSCGDGFVMDVAPVSNPAASTFSPESGVNLDARVFFERGVYENPDIDDTPSGGGGSDEDIEDEVYEPLDPFVSSITENYLPEDVADELFAAFEEKSETFNVISTSHMPMAYTDAFTLSDCRILSITVPVARTKSADSNGNLVFTLMKIKNSANGIISGTPIKTYKIRINAEEYGLTPSRQTVNKVITVDLSKYYIELAEDETLAFGGTSDTLLPAILKLEGNMNTSPVSTLGDKFPQALGAFRNIPNGTNFTYAVNALCFDFVIERGFDSEAQKEAYLNEIAEAEEEYQKSVEALKDLYEGKNMSVIGDSISTFTDFSSNPDHNLTLEDNTVRGPYYPANDVTTNTYTKTYWGRLIEEIGFTHCVTNAMSGAYATGSGKGDALPERATELHRDNGTSTRADDTDPDVIIVYNGINDAMNGRAVGNLYSLLNAAGTKSDYDIVDGWFANVLSSFKANGGVVNDKATFQSFAEAYALSLYLMKEKYQDAEIYCVTLLYNYESTLSESTINSYNRVIKALSEYFGATVVDQNGELSEMTRENLHTHACLVDSSCVHPKSSGHLCLERLIVKTMAQKNGIAYND